MTETRLSPVKISHRQPFAVSPIRLRDQPPNVPIISPRPSPWRVNLSGYGSRHIYDDAPFTLWNEEMQQFRNLSDEEGEWIVERYNAESIFSAMPDLVVFTNSPPANIPFTLAGALVRFVPPGLDICGNLPALQHAIYGDPTAEDLLDYRLRRYSMPTKQEMCDITEKLSQFMDIRAVYFTPPRIIVDLDPDTKRTYGPRSLPAFVGAITIEYHHSPTEYLDVAERAYSRLIAPSESEPDMSDYLNTTSPTLSPGVCVSSAYLSQDDVQTDAYRTTTAGVQVQLDANRYITVANHGFSSNDVYHPDPQGHHIGKIEMRHHLHDIALVKLNPSVNFTNRRYFAATAPERLIHSSTIPGTCTYFSVDGYSSGLVDFLFGGSKLVPRRKNPLPPHVDTKIRDMKFVFHNVFFVFGDVNQFIAEGMCGAPLVDMDGGVAGMFRYTNPSGTVALTSAVDPFIDLGWTMV